MKTEIKTLLEQLANINKMTKISDKYYRGPAGTLFKITSFGFHTVTSITETIEAGEIEKSLRK